MRDAAPRMAEIPQLQLAQILAAKRMIEQRRQDGAIALLLAGFSGGRGEQLARLMVTERWGLASPLSAFGRLTPFTGFCATALRSQRYSNSDESAARRLRMVQPAGCRLSALLPICRRSKSRRKSGGSPENVVRTVTENSGTPKFTTHGFEEE